jgi:hypothetical protein
MWLAHRHQRKPAKDWAATPFWSLMLPRWAAAQPVPSYRVGEPESATWTCEADVKGTAAVTRHVESHRTRGAGEPTRVPAVPGW